jgi:hypothetical protein
MAQALHEPQTTDHTQQQKQEQQEQEDCENAGEG